MDFDLVSTYNTIQQDIKENDDKEVKQGVSLQQKRENKTAKCDKCNKMFNPKTLKYSHDCTKPKQSLEDKRNNKVVKNENNNDNQNQNQNHNQYKIYNEPNDDDIEQYLMKRERIHREKQAIIRAEKFQKLIKNAF